MNDKLYSKKTLRAALRDLESKNEQLRAELIDTQRVLLEANERVHAMNTQLADNFRNNELTAANARIVSPKVLRSFAAYTEGGVEVTTVAKVKRVRDLTRDESGVACGLKEAYDFVKFSEGRAYEIIA